MQNIRTVEELQQQLNAIKDEMNGVKKVAPVSDERKAHAYASAFWEHMHTGIPENALKEGSDGSGGYLVPDTYETQLVNGLREKNIMRELATTISTTHKMRFPRVLETGTAQWVPENESFVESNITLGEVILDAYKIGTMVRLSDELLEDSGFDLEAYIRQEFADRIGECEETAFINGNGVDKPLGILSQAQVGVVSEAVGELHLDDMIDLEYSLKGRYRSNAVWLMSENAYTTLRKIRVIGGRPLWTSNLSEGEPEMLFGHRLYVSKNLPDVTPGSKPVLFGDFSYYWIGDRGKRIVKRLSERYADQGQVGFLATQRVDAALVLPEAVKVLEIKA